MSPWELMKRARRDADGMADAVLDEAIRVGDVMNADNAGVQVIVYTKHELEAVIDEWEQGGKPRFESDKLMGTVEALGMAIELHHAACEQRDKARAEVARLRALIAEQERGNHYNESNPSCPWCGISGEWEGFESMPAMRHADDCPAFSAPGVVR